MKILYYARTTLFKQGKSILLLGLLLCTTSFLRAQNLVWEENFDGTNINPDNWTFDFGDGCERGICGWGNQELEYYTSRPENARLENGNLLIEARRENFQGKPFTSARLKTYGRVHFKYGTLEARIKVPDLKNGLWPAFWMLGTAGVWPASGEIDIMEMGSAGAIRDGVVNKRAGAAVHWESGNNQADYNQDYNSPTDLTDDYHVYKMTWDAEAIKVFIDGVQFFNINIAGAAGSDLEEFHQSQYIILNLAVGGLYTGIPTPEGVTAPLPGKMYVDYVKLYQNAGDELYLGKDNAFAGNFGIYTENSQVNNKLTYGQDANLYIWNNLANITGAAAYEGNEVLALRAAAGNWFGFGVENKPINLLNFADGFLKFNMKTSYNGQFKVGVKSGHGESWINFAPGASPYGLVRDGQWHEVSIPLSAFNNPNMGMHIDLGSITQSFMFAGDAPGATADFYIDNIHYSGGVAANPAPEVSLTSPASEAVFFTSSPITISANASDANGTVTKVDFFSNNALLGSDDTSPYSFTWNNAPAGVHTITAKASDNEGTVTTSKPITLYVTAPNHAPPAVSITSPTAASSFTTPATVTINANATDDGSVYKVEFYNGTTLLGTDFTSPFSYTWSGVAAGTYSITAKATDNGKLTTTSEAVSVLVKDNTVVANEFGIYSEKASITQKLVFGQDANLYIWNGLTPISGAAPFEGNDVLALRATPGNWFGFGIANDVKNINHFKAGSLRFHFKTSFAGAFKLGIITSGGESWIEFPANVQKFGLVRDGEWHEVVIPMVNFANVDLTNLTQAFVFAGDAPATNGDFYLDNIYFSTQAPANTAPVVTITSPTASAVFTAPATISIATDASDPDGSVSKVEYFNGTTKIGEDLTAPFSFTWNNVAAGAYTLSAKATDNGGLVSTSAEVKVTVQEAASRGPNLALNKPVTVSSLENPSTPGTNAVDGSLTTRWASAFSDPQWLSVDLGAAYNINEVKITWEPAYAKAYEVQTSLDGTTWTNVKTVTGNSELVNDHTGLTANGRYVRIYGTQRATPYGYSIFELEVYGAAPDAYCGTAANGDYSYKAVTSGENVNFTFHPLGATAGGNLAIIYIKEGAANGYPGYTMAKNSAGDFTFSKPIAAGTPLSIYFTYQVGPNGPERNSAATPHNYTVGATCGGVPGTSAPTVSITSPTSSATYSAPATITINADAADTDGSVAQVEFYQGTDLLGSDNTAPYSFTWNNVAAGTYSISVKAIDNTGLSTSSTAVQVVVNSATSSGTNLALNKPVTTSSIEAPGTAGGNAVDGNMTTRWSSAFSDPQWLAVNLGKSYKVNQVKITWEPAYAKNYQVQVSDDGITWNTIKDVVGNSTLVNDHIGLEATGQYIRIYGTERALPYGYSIYELEVYGEENSVPENTPPTVAITSPSNTTFTAPASISLTASATDVNGTVALVEYFSGTTKLGEAISAPYTVTWTNVMPGTYVLIAKATDNGGLTATSQPITIQVNYPDADGDGVTSETDCNDANSAVYPGATEVCDGLDNDCDGQTDEGVKTIFYADSDKDGFGDAAVTTLACEAPAGYVSKAGDCNDQDASINPGATDLCDGIDRNCDGKVRAPMQAPTITVTPSSNVYTGGIANTLYLGYGAKSVTLTAQAAGAVSFAWNAAPGLTNTTSASATFTPTAAGTYTFTVLSSNSDACTSNASVTIKVIDVRGGKKQDKVVVCHKGTATVVGLDEVQTHLSHGDKLGACTTSSVAATHTSSLQQEVPVALRVYPNPVKGNATIEFTSVKAGQFEVAVYDLKGTLVKVVARGKATQSQSFTYEVDATTFAEGVYMIRLVSENEIVTQRLMVTH
ncbi:Ig-like domain-containing protein [Rufibacter aurantiacus]|uniref:Ig-like domain-containing protein n=1 Tax=Rufibacter aurantiacus TaxID=2817374 RepID=UPI001B30AE94|nr:Ig-like domain-containing protein [Rufibacter aurantiacus]